MLILSQDKSRIFNFNTITDVNVEYVNGDYELRTSFVGEKGSFNMGEYDTEERAKEVLQDIIKTYKFNINFKYNKFLTEKEVIEMQNDLVYEMPEK